MKKNDSTTTTLIFSILIVLSLILMLGSFTKLSILGYATKDLDCKESICSEWSECTLEVTFPTIKTPNELKSTQRQICESKICGKYLKEKECEKTIMNSPPTDEEVTITQGKDKNEFIIQLGPSNQEDNPSSIQYSPQIDEKEGNGVINFFRNFFHKHPPY